MSSDREVIEAHRRAGELVEPIGFALVRARFELPATIRLVPELDRIVDDGNRAQSHGGTGARSLPGYRPPPGLRG